MPLQASTQKKVGFKMKLFKKLANSKENKCMKLILDIYEQNLEETALVKNVAHSTVC